MPDNMPSSIAKILAVAVLAFASITCAAPADLPLRDLVKRGGWNSASTCPSGDGQEYDGPKGGAWTVRCGMDTMDTSNLQSTQASSFIDCIQQCGSYAGCRRVAFTADVNGPGPCFLKNGNGGLVSTAGHKVATKLN